MAKTALQKSYQKEVSRINRFIREAEKRGFIFNKAEIQKMIPEKGSRITKQKIQALKEIKPAKLYGKAVYREPETGIVMSGFKGREYERKKAARKGAGVLREINGVAFAKYMVIRQQLGEMAMTYYAPGWGGYTVFLNSAIQYFGGEEEFIRVIANVPDVLTIMYDRILWESDDSAEQKAGRDAAWDRLMDGIGMPQDVRKKTMEEIENKYYV